AELLLRGADRVVDRDERRAGALVQLLGGQPPRVVRRQLLTLRSARSGGPLLAAPGPGDQRDGGDADEADGEERAEGADAPAVAAGRSAADGAAGRPLLLALGRGARSGAPVVLSELGLDEVRADLRVSRLRDQRGPATQEVRAVLDRHGEQ